MLIICDVSRPDVDLNYVSIKYLHCPLCDIIQCGPTNEQLSLEEATPNNQPTAEVLSRLSYHHPREHTAPSQPPNDPRLSNNRRRAKLPQIAALIHLGNNKTKQKNTTRAKPWPPNHLMTHQRHSFNTI